MINLCKAEGVPSAPLDLHSTFPMQGDLPPNPDWSRLPLFDRKDWTRIPARANAWFRRNCARHS